MPTTAKPKSAMVVLIVLFLCSLNLSAFAASDESNLTSIYDVLRAHGLPAGLMPKGVKEFKYDENGRFEVHLDQACNAKFESELHYERNVSGALSCGQIGELSGILAQDLFLWFPVKKIQVDIPSSGLIYFDVGVVQKQFSLSLFETPPECMAGTLDPEGLVWASQDKGAIVQVVSKEQGKSRRVRSQLGQKSFASDVM